MIPRNRKRNKKLLTLIKSFYTKLINYFFKITIQLRF